MRYYDDIIIRNDEWYLSLANAEIQKMEPFIDWELKNSNQVGSYFGYIGALYVVFVDLNLLLILRSHFGQGFSQFIFILLLPSRVHLNQSSLIPLSGLLHFLQHNTVTIQTSS